MTTASARWNGHLWLRDQLRRSASSACANVAEGFGRYRPREFARFLSIAKGSLNELVEHIGDAELLGLIPRKIIKTRGSFPTDEAAIKLVWLALRKICAAWVLPAQRGKPALHAFALAYGDRFLRREI